MNLATSSNPLFYSSIERSLYFLQLDEFLYRVNGPSMLIISLDKPLEVIDIEEKKHLSHTLLIPAGMPHTIKTDRAKVAICYLKGTGSDLKKLIPLMAIQITVNCQHLIFSHVKFEAMLIAQAKDIWREKPKACDVLQKLEDLINTFDALHDKNINYQVDARVVEVIDMIKENISENVSVSDMAKKVDISASRLTQIFRAATGTSIRTFRLWERVFYTTRCLQSGISITDAAIKAGFADYGQFFRVYNEMGGRLSGRAKNTTVIKAG
jgi:AraC-like DNA-binding protein